MIYCFFSLLVEYLGGESNIMSMLRGRAPTPHYFPLNLFLPPIDLSDPYTFLALKRGIMRASCADRIYPAQASPCSCYTATQAAWVVRRGTPQHAEWLYVDCIIVQCVAEC